MKVTINNSNICFLILTIFSYPWTDLSAQGSLKIGPTEITFTGKPGQVGSSIITIDNNTEDPAKILSRIFDVKQSVTIKLTAPGSTPYSCSDWTSVNPESLIVEPGVKKEIEVTVRPPGGSMGSYHGAIQLIILPAQFSSKTAVGAQVAPTVLTTVVIDRTERYNLEVVNIEIADLLPVRKGINQQSMPTAIISMKNTGNALVSFSGRINIRHNETNMRVATGSVPNPENYKNPPTIIPATTMPIFIPLSRQIQDGEYVGEIAFQYNKNKWLRVKIPFVVGSVASTGSDKALHLLYVEVTPTRLTMSVPSNGRRSAVIKIKNLEEKSIHLSAELSVLALSADGVPMREVGSADPSILSPYIKLQSVPETINPGRQDRIVISISMPGDDRPPPNCLLTVYARQENETSAEPSEYTCPILLSRAGAIPVQPADIEIEDVQYIPSLMQKGRNMIVLTLIKTSDSYAEIYGNIEIREEAGYRYGRQEFGRQEPLLILPGGKREIDVYLNAKEVLQKNKTYLAVCNIGIKPPKSARSNRTANNTVEIIKKFTLAR